MIASADLTLLARNRLAGLDENVIRSLQTDLPLTGESRGLEDLRADVRQADFRTAVACFVSGVTVVTTIHKCQPYGLTVSAFCSVSLDPPLVLVSLQRSSRTLPMIGESGVYAVNVLTAEQQLLAARFAASDPAVKIFTDIPHHLGATGAPLLDAALTRIECRVAASYPGGDHTLLLGAVVAIEGPDERFEGPPLLAYRSALQALQRQPIVV